MGFEPGTDHNTILVTGLIVGALFGCIGGLLLARGIEELRYRFGIKIYRRH